MCEKCAKNVLFAHIFRLHRGPGAHRNVVAVVRHGILVNSPSYYLDMELCDYNLGSHMKGEWMSVPIPEKLTTIAKIADDIANGVAFFHDHKEIHRDIKPQNSIYPSSTTWLTTVLYSSREDSCKITDFGITAEGTGKRAIDTRYARGTSCYRAPELVRNCQYTNKVDIWALGCNAYELFFGRKAFADDIAVFQYSVSNKPLQFPSHVTIEEPLRTGLLERLQAMLNRNPHSRPSAIDLCCNSFWAPPGLIVADAGPKVNEDHTLLYGNPLLQNLALEQSSVSATPDGSCIVFDIVPDINAARREWLNRCCLDSKTHVYFLYQ